MTTEPVPAVEHVACDEERARLSLLAREMVYRFSRFRRQADQIVVENVSLPSTLFPGLLERDQMAEIGVLAKKYRLLLGEATEWISIDTASKTIANALGVPVGTAILRRDRIVHMRAGRPVEWRTAYGVDPDPLTKLGARLRAR